MAVYNRRGRTRLHWRLRCIVRLANELLEAQP